MSKKMTTGEPTTGEIVRALRDAPNYNGMAGTTTTVEDIAADRIEQQEQRIAELEAENREIRQNSVSHTTLAEFVSDYQEQLDEKDAKIAELNDFQNSQCAKLLVRNGELERELEWKDKVIELAQRKQDEAERERDALISSIERLRTKKIELCSICEFEDLIACCHKNHCEGYQLFKWRGLPQEGEGKENG